MNCRSRHQAAVTRRSGQSTSNNFCRQPPKIGVSKATSSARLEANEIRTSEDVGSNATVVTRSKNWAMESSTNPKPS